MPYVCPCNKRHRYFCREYYSDEEVDKNGKLLSESGRDLVAITCLSRACKDCDHEVKFKE